MLGGATNVGSDRGAQNRASRERARFASASWSRKSSVPEGYRPPYSIIIAVRDGEIASRARTTGTGALTASAAGGKNGAADLAGSGTIVGLGQLIVSAVAALVGTGTLTGNAIANLLAVAALAGSGNVVGALLALGLPAAALTGAGTLAATRYATGTLGASITPFTELSPQSLATAVWGQIIEAGYSAEEIVRLLAAHAAGDATGLNGSTAFVGIDGSTVRIEGTTDGATRTIGSLNGS